MLASDAKILIDEINRQSPEPLTEWERGFLKDVAWRAGKGVKFTPSQSRVLQEIYRKTHAIR